MPAPDPKPKATRRNKSEIHARMAEIMSALDIRNEFLQLLLDEVTIELSFAAHFILSQHKRSFFVMF
jgi:hypothetical protein